MFVLLMLPAICLIPLGPFFRWAMADWRATLRALRPALIVAVIAAITAKLITHDLPLRGVVGVAASLWVGLGIILYAVYRWRTAPRGRRFTPEMLGMILAHFGVAVFLAGVLIVEATSIERDLRVAPKEVIEIGGLGFRFQGVQRTQGPNYIADEGTIDVLEGDTLLTTMHPQKRAYSSGSPQTISAIRPGLFSDLYVALGEPLDNGAWSVRIYVKPFVRWIWLGGLCMMLGGFIAATDRRFRVLPARADEKNAVPATDVAQTAT
jgi:cytochrome c-type biogenesis protein CcmF